MIPTGCCSIRAPANGSGGRCAIRRMPEVSSFLDRDIRGFGLFQRDRNFDHYQDLDLAYETRPSYFIEPHGSWGDGRVELVELRRRTRRMTTSSPLSCQGRAGARPHFGYRITSSLNFARLSPNGRVVNTFQTEARALRSPETVSPGSRRFIIDFSGGELADYAQAPQMVEGMADDDKDKFCALSSSQTPM